MTQYVAYFEDNEVKFLEGEFTEKNGLLFFGEYEDKNWWSESHVKDTKEKAISALYENFNNQSKILVDNLNSFEKKRHIIANAYMEMQ